MQSLEAASAVCLEQLVQADTNRLWEPALIRLAVRLSSLYCMHTTAHLHVKSSQCRYSANLC